jgi:predicted RNA binding protein YcfA (HicA-like mRNA interferase family)
MGKKEKLLQKILSGQGDYNIPFNDLNSLLLSLGFKRRQEGSHMLFTKEKINERINLQAEGSKAKGYQVKQVRKILTNYNLELLNEDE